MQGLTSKFTIEEKFKQFFNFQQNAIVTTDEKTFKNYLYDKDVTIATSPKHIKYFLDPSLKTGIKNMLNNIRQRSQRGSRGEYSNVLGQITVNLNKILTKLETIENYTKSDKTTDIVQCKLKVGQLWTEILRLRPVLSRQNRKRRAADIYRLRKFNTINFPDYDKDKKRPEGKYLKGWMEEVKIFNRREPTTLEQDRAWQVLRTDLIWGLPNPISIQKQYMTEGLTNTNGERINSDNFGTIFKSLSPSTVELEGKFILDNFRIMSTEESRYFALARRNIIDGPEEFADPNNCINTGAHQCPITVSKSQFMATILRGQNSIILSGIPTPDTSSSLHDNTVITENNSGRNDSDYPSLPDTVSEQESTHSTIESNIPTPKPTNKVIPLTSAPRLYVPQPTGNSLENRQPTPSNRQVTDRYSQNEPQISHGVQQENNRRQEVIRRQTSQYDPVATSTVQNDTLSNTTWESFSNMIIRPNIVLTNVTPRSEDSETVSITPRQTTETPRTTRPVTRQDRANNCINNLRSGQITGLCLQDIIQYVQYGNSLNTVEFLNTFLIMFNSNLENWIKKFNSFKNAPTQQMFMEMCKKQPAISHFSKNNATMVYTSEEKGTVLKATVFCSTYFCHQLEDPKIWLISKEKLFCLGDRLRNNIFICLSDKLNIAPPCHSAKSASAHCNFHQFAINDPKSEIQPINSETAILNPRLNKILVNKQNEMIFSNGTYILSERKQNVMHVLQNSVYMLKKSEIFQYLDKPDTYTIKMIQAATKLYNNKTAYTISVLSITLVGVIMMGYLLKVIVERYRDYKKVNQDENREMIEYRVQVAE